MIGPFLTRVFIMAFGYAYPAYECFKTVERNKPEIEQLRFWCQYWILVAVLGVFERFADNCISWLPMYSEAKLVFFVYLWYPKLKGTTYVYHTFLRPYVAKHESEIDRNLLELKARAGDIAVLYWQKAATYGQTRFFDILHYAISQSHGFKSPPLQQLEQQMSQPPNTPTTRRPPVQLPQVRSPPSPTKGKASAANEGTESAMMAVDAPTSQSPTPSGSSSKPGTGSDTSPSPSPDQVDVSKSLSNDGPKPPTSENVMEETIRLSRSRLRRTRAVITPNHAATAVTTAGGTRSH